MDKTLWRVNITLNMLSICSWMRNRLICYEHYQAPREPIKFPNPRAKPRRDRDRNSHIMFNWQPWELDHHSDCRPSWASFSFSGCILRIKEYTKRIVYKRSLCLLKELNFLPYLQFFSVNPCVTRVCMKLCRWRQMVYFGLFTSC